MTTHELFARVNPAIVHGMLDWFRSHDRAIYTNAISSLAGTRKLRPEFVRKKPLVEQYQWVHKALQSKATESIGEHLLQVYLLAGQQSLLIMFCDGMGIPHDGKGSVVGDLPKALDEERLNTTVARLLEVFDPKLLTLYLHCFNNQVRGGYPTLSKLLETEPRLAFD